MQLKSIKCILKDKNQIWLTTLTKSEVLLNPRMKSSDDDKI